MRPRSDLGTRSDFADARVSRQAGDLDRNGCGRTGLLHGGGHEYGSQRHDLAGVGHVVDGEGDRDGGLAGVERDVLHHLHGGLVGQQSEGDDAAAVDDGRHDRGDLGLVKLGALRRHRSDRNAEQADKGHESQDLLHLGVFSCSS